MNSNFFLPCTFVWVVKCDLQIILGDPSYENCALYWNFGKV